MKSVWSLLCAPGFAGGGMYAPAKRRYPSTSFSRLAGPVRTVLILQTKEWLPVTGRLNKC